MEHTDSENFGEERNKDILQAGVNAALMQGLQPADAEACEIDFELHMRDPDRMNAWASKSFSLSWLNSCARNFAANFRRDLEADHQHERADQAAQMEAAAHASQEPEPEPSALKAEIRQELDAALASLPENERAMIWMRAREQRSHSEIAAAFGATPASVRMTIKRALAIVRSHLELAGFDSDEGMRILESPPPRVTPQAND